MTDIIVVVDAQNGFCNADGRTAKKLIKTEKKRRELKETVGRIKTFLATARTRDMPIIYLCANLWSLNSDSHWQAEVHAELAPREKEPLFWRKDPSEDPFCFGLGYFLKEFPDPHLLLCGFYSNMCVELTALCALGRKLPVSFVLDCMFPHYDKKMQKLFFDFLRNESCHAELGTIEAVRLLPQIDVSLVSFCTLSDLFHNA